MLFYALSNVLFYYQLSVEKYGFIQPLLIAAAVQITAIAIFHQTVVMVGDYCCVKFAIYIPGKLKVSIGI